MTAEIIFRPFSEIFLTSLRNGLTRPTAIRGEGVKMVNMGEIFAYSRIKDIDMDRVPLSEDEAQRYILESGDLLFARQSLVLSGAGKCSIFLGDAEPITFEGHLIRARLNLHLADPHFYYYFFNSTMGRGAMESIVEQVAAAGIRATDLAKLRVPYLPLNDQRAIARVLGSLDDKIELNRKMNDILEETARAIFQSWFVDFDPVHAKVAGRAPAGLDAATAALFPDSFEEVDGRMVPRGWKVRRIGDMVSVVGGSTPSTKEATYWDGGDIHWTTPKDLSSLSSPVLLDTERRITDLGLQQISSGLLPEGTILLSSRAPIGYLAITMIPTAINQGFIAMICDKELPNYYVFLWAGVNLDLIKSRANGTTFLEISKSNFRPMEIFLPTQQILESFVSTVKPIYDLMGENLKQSHTLTHLRDTLLPRLLSGDLRVDS